MPRNIQLLKQVRSAVSAVCRDSENADHKVQLGIVDMYLNELMQQDDAVFYLDFLAGGRALLQEGVALASRHGGVPKPAVPFKQLDEGSRAELINADIDTLNEALVGVVTLLQEHRSEEERDYLQRLTRWESTLYLRRLEQTGVQQAAAVQDLTAETLEHYLREKFPQCASVKVTGFNTLEGGISKKTILFETDQPIFGTCSMVMRAEQPSKMLYFGGSDVDREFYMIALMKKLGMPVPDALWLEADAAGWARAFW